MIRCPSCEAKTFYVENRCPNCGFSPIQLDGFFAWAPELANSNNGFRKEGFETLIKIEQGSFWFRARNSIIQWALHKYFPDFQSILEVGCGTGFVLQGITQSFPHARIVGSEIYTVGLSAAARRLPDVELFQMDARKLPYEEEFDLVGAFDVIEHILEDGLVLQNFYRAIKPGGGCLITVPQHQWLWSSTDETACHQRRYSATELHAKVEAAGFRIVRSTSFVTLLLPLMLLSRLTARRSGDISAKKDLALNPTLDRILESIMKIESHLIKWGVNLPIGGSRLIVLKK
jgi:ubiquinone/menaquinone biosynthesis C-methylase UbiE